MCGCSRKPLLRPWADIAEAALPEKLGGIQSVLHDARRGFSHVRLTGRIIMLMK